MATKSIQKNIKIESRTSVTAFVNALELAERKDGEESVDSTTSNPPRFDVSAEEIRKMLEKD